MTLPDMLKWLVCFFIGHDHSYHSVRCMRCHFAVGTKHGR